MCANHISAYDPFVICVHIKNQVHYIGKKELFQNKVAAWLLNKLGAYPVDRSTADLKAIKKTIRFLKDGEIIGIFAQGKRVKEGENVEAKSGVALFAIKGDCPVLPVGISGQYKRHHPITVRFGKPVSLDSYKGQKLSGEVLAHIADKLMEHVNELIY